MLVVEYRLRPGVLRGLGGSRRLEWPRMPRLRFPKYPEQEYFAHLASIFDKMLRGRGYDCIDTFKVAEGAPRACCLCQAGNEQNGTRNLNSLAGMPY